jgi:hypothetical protein
VYAGETISGASSETGSSKAGASGAGSSAAKISEGSSQEGTKVAGTACASSLRYLLRMTHLTVMLPDNGLGITIAHFNKYKKNAKEICKKVNANTEI